MATKRRRGRKNEFVDTSPPEELDETAWRKLVAKARNLFPTDCPVRVSRHNVPDSVCGDCVTYYLDGRVHSHVIRVHPELQRQAAIDTLLHEWAHALHAELLVQQSDAAHDDDYWLIFGQLFRAWRGEP